MPAPAAELDIVQLTESEWSKVRNERSMPLDHVQIIRLGDVGQVGHQRMCVANVSFLTSGQLQARSLPSCLRTRNDAVQPVGDADWTNLHMPMQTSPACQPANTAVAVAGIKPQTCSAALLSWQHAAQGDAPLKHVLSVIIVPWQCADERRPVHDACSTVSRV